MSEQPSENGKPAAGELARAWLAPELRELVDDGTIRFISESPEGIAEYAIDGLAHRMRGGGGWIDVYYGLTVDVNATGEGFRYVVEDDSEQGGDVVFCSNDGEEVAAWIVSEIEGKGE